MEKRKIGAAYYLNTKPLVHGFIHDENLKSKTEMIFDIPAEGEVRLRNNLIDFALIPSIEFARGYQLYELIPSGCIASDGEVRSVLLYFNKDLKDIRTIAIDTSSRTSVALLKIIMVEKFNIHPDYIPMKPEIEDMLSKCDAALLIGDNALKNYSNYPFLDMGDEWMDFTGLPFTYAVWAGRRDKVLESDLELLEKSRKIGVENIAEIAKDEFGKTGIHSPDFYQDYLTDFIKFELTDDRYKGMVEYFQMAFMLGLIPDIPEIHRFGEKKAV